MSTRKALAFSFLERYSGLVIHTISSMIIARLLTPTEIGVYSVVMVLLGFVAALRDFGAGQYMVQHKTLSEKSLGAIWTVQLGLGLLFALLTVASSSLVADFYGDPRMREIMYVLSMNFAITPFLAFPNAWLIREMRFGILAGVRITGAITHACIAIALAWAGWGPISMAWANFATTFAGIIAIRVLASTPSPRLSMQEIRSVVSFGGRLTIVSFIETMRTGAPELILGRIQNLTAAGLFSRGQGLVSMFQQLVLSAVGSVALPYFAKEFREGRPLGASFVLSVELITGLGWSFFGGLALLAYPAIRILYGNQWDAAVEPTRWLAIAAALGLPGLLCSAPMIAVGAVTGVLRASAVSMVLSIVAILAGVSFGTTAVAQLLAISTLMSSTYWLSLAHSILDYSWQAMLRAAARSIFLALATLAAPLFTIQYFGWLPNDIYLVFFISLPCALLSFLLAAHLFQHALWQEIQRAILVRFHSHKQ